MTTNASKIRIKDIATQAGVSEGTVDRVLHNRGEVSEKSRKAVQKALTELGYQPNIYARSLALKKQYHFALFIPSYNPGDYWEAIDNGITQAAQEFSNFNATVTRYYYNQYDVNSFVEQTHRMLQNELDAVVIVPTFSNEAKKLIEQLQERNIPYSFIDSMIEDGNFLGYYGQHSFQSGFIAAKLLLSDLPANSEILLVRTIRSENAVSNQTKNRYIGFMEYVKQNGLSDKFQYLTMQLQDNDNAANQATLKAAFEKHTHIKAAIIFNSKVYRLAKYFEDLNKTDIKLIGYDLLTDNVKYLKSGAIDYLIAQRPEKQAYMIIRDLCKNLIFNQETVRINYLPIDILMKENIDYYMEFL